MKNKKKSIPACWETGLIGGKEKRNIQIDQYDSGWPMKFEKHKKIIFEALGEVAISIEHIGSTSVPGLAAKPIIDILLVVKDSGQEDNYLVKMNELGYQLRVREPEYHEHRMFRTIERDVHIHVLSEGSVEIERYLTFRNRLRRNEGDRTEYERMKIKLASLEWDDTNEYAQAKTEVVERIIAAGMRDLDPS